MGVAMFANDGISSGESEGAFNEFNEDQLEHLVDTIISEGEISGAGERGSEVIVDLAGRTTIGRPRKRLGPGPS